MQDMNGRTKTKTLLLAQVERINQHLFIVLHWDGRAQNLSKHVMQCYAMQRCDAFHCSGNGKCTHWCVCVLCAVSTNATATATNQNDIFFSFETKMETRPKN